MTFENNGRKYIMGGVSIRSNEIRKISHHKSRMPIRKRIYKDQIQNNVKSVYNFHQINMFLIDVFKGVTYVYPLTRTP